MEDEKIIELYFKRNESAIEETDRKYGRYLGAVAYRLLSSREDAEECVSDTYLKAWQTIPPERPSIFKAFLSKITRSRALDRLDYYSAEKRSAQSTLMLEELGDAIPSYEGDMADALSLKAALDGFLASQPKRVRVVFLRRYFYFYSVREIALSLHLSESNVKAILMRARIALKGYLEKEGIVL